MATEDTENNNFLNELKNVLQRFGHLDSEEATPPENDDDAAASGSTCSDVDRKSTAATGNNCISPPSPSTEVRHRTYFHPRTPQTPLASFRKDLSVRRSTSGGDVDDEYPPKSPPKTVFQQIPKSPQDALRRLRTGSDNSTSLESISGGETLRTGSAPRRKEGGSEGRSRSTSSEGRSAGGVVKTDLYNELNTVLRRRNEKGQQAKVLDLEKMKSGKTTVYYGRGRLISSSDEGFSPSPTRVRAATIDIGGTGNARSSNVNKASAVKTAPAEGKTKPTSTAPPPPTPPPLPAVLTDRKSVGSGESQEKVPPSPPPPPGQNAPRGRPLVRPASISPPDRRSTSTTCTTTSVVAESPSPQSDHFTPPIELDLSHPGGARGQVTLLAAADGATSTDETDGAGHWSSPQRVLSGDCTSDGGDCTQQLPAQRAVVGDGANSDDPHNYPTLPIRPGMEARLGPLPPPPPPAPTLENRRLSPGGITMTKTQTKHPAVTKTSSGPPRTPPSFMLELPKFSPGGGGGSSSYKDLTDMSCSTSDYDYQLPFPPSNVRRAFSSDDSATSAETGVTECRRLGRKQAPKAMSWHSLMFVTGDDRWIEHYPHPVDLDGSSGSGVRTSGGKRCRSYGNLMVTRADLGGAQKLFRSSGLPSSRPVNQRRRWGSRGADASLSKAYATFPPPRWTRGGAHQAGADDDLLTSLLITHSGERLPPSDTESSANGGGGGVMNRRRGPEMATGRTGGRLKAHVTVPLPTSFHMHGNHVGNNLLNTASASAASVAVLNLPEVSSPEPDYDLTATEDEEEHHVTDSDDHVGCHVCMSLADETSEKVLDTQEEGDTTLEEMGDNGESDPLLLKRPLHGATTTTDGEADGETEDSTDLDTTGNRNRKCSTMPVAIDKLNHHHYPHREPFSRRALPPIDDRRNHTWGSPTSPVTSQPHWSRHRQSRVADDSDSSAYRARQWCRSTTDMPTCARSHNQSHDPSKEPLVVSDSYSSDDNRQQKSLRRSALIAATSGTATTSTTNTALSKTNKNYSVGNSIQSMCTYIVDSYDHSSDADTESLCQDYDAYEKALIQYVKTEDLSQMNPDIRTLYWQQLDARSLRALRLQPRRVLHKFICCFVCDRPLKARRPVRRHPGHPGPPRPHHSGGGHGRAARRGSKALPAPSYDDKGCPLTQKITDDSSVTVYGDGLLKGEEGKPTSFFVKTDSNAHGDLWVQVDGPNSIAKCNIESREPGLYQVTYIPVETGTYTIQIKWNGKLVVGCPYRPKIGRASDSRKVMLLQSGHVSSIDQSGRLILRVNQVKRLEFDATAAGSGTLTAQLASPAGNLPVEIHPLGDRKYVVSFTPVVEGEHQLSVYWDGSHVAQSPFSGHASGGMAMAHPPVNHEKVVLTGRGLREARVREEAQFVVDGRSAGPGIPTVTLKGVKGNEVEVTPLPIGNNMFRFVYKPTIPGAYLLNIMWSDRQVKGSPFKVNVVSSSDASRVVASGEGLKMGVMGQEIKSVIDTRRAGPGELTAHCQGPRKEAYCSLYNNHDGTFTLTIKPQEPGKHILQIKYDDEHVPGSPFTLRVSGAPDASQVRVSGPGIEHGVLALFQSRFLVETRGAGAGQLTVRIRGPKGAFRVEMQRESSKDRTILCRYDPTEVGDYMVHIKWSGEHVPGSPFHVRICDTQDELERVLVDSNQLNSLQSTRTLESRMHNMDF